MMHICICKLTTIGLYNDLLPGQRQAIIWINVGILLIQTIAYIFIQENAVENVICKMVAVSSQPQCVNQLSSYAKLLLRFFPVYGVNFTLVQPTLSSYINYLVFMT